MPTYVAMLRGINVTGHNIVKMELLRASFAAMGFKDAKTYVQSGNVVFKSDDSVARLVEKIEKKILRDFGFAVSVFVRTAKEMQETVKRNSFVKDPAIDQARLHVTFLADAAPKTAVDLLQPLITKPEQIRVMGREIYLYCPNSYGNSKLSNNAIETKLGIGATTRNWKTTQTLLAMTQ